MIVEAGGVPARLGVAEQVEATGNFHESRACTGERAPQSFIARRTRAASFDWEMVPLLTEAA